MASVLRILVSVLGSPEVPKYTLKIIPSFFLSLLIRIEFLGQKGRGGIYHTSGCKGDEGEICLSIFRANVQSLTIPEKDIWM